MVTIMLLIIVLALSLLPTSLNSMWDTVHEMQDPSLLLAKEWTQKFPMVKRAQLSSVTREAEKCWQRAFGQYSLLLDFDYHPWNVLCLLSLGLVDATREGQKAGEKIVLTDEVIERILSGFKESNGQLKDGQQALAKNELGNHFSWACTVPTHIHKILV